MPETEQASRGELSTDQCVIDEDESYILDRIEIPVFDHPESFVWLAWVSLSLEDFLRAQDLWDTEGRETEPPCKVILASALSYTPS
ncbi:DUF2199 domain-containing protein, partial [Verrucomicrobia bacterium]|nr:DUF2199 domain-containing protein [Verrucomicrobiota bacterium]